MNRKRILLSALVLAVCSILVFGCKKSSNNVVAPSPTAGYIKIAEGYAAGAATKVEIYAVDSAFTGYNKLYIALLDSVNNTFVETAQVTLMPNMDMMSLSHSAPYENPASTSAVNKMFPCSVCFIMPSSGGTWTLAVNVQNLINSKNGMATLNINVKDPSTVRMFSFISLIDSGKYFVSLIPPVKPIVGINDFEVVVYKKQSMMIFPADSTLSISFIPTMPTMSHSSPNNVDPVHTEKGHYKGKVNFTMTGFWRLSTTFRSGMAVADSAHYFDITF